MNTIRNINQVQQGDIQSIKIDGLPANTKVVSRNHFMLAHGENGHCHVIDAPNTELRESIDGIKFLVNNNNYNVVSTHEEHKPTVYSPGIHKLGIVREKDYFEDMVRSVMD